MEVGEALAVLRLAPGATWGEVRTRYRHLLRTTHPDLTDDPAASDRTARLTAAYAVLQRATNDGRRPLPAPAPPRRPAGGAPAGRPQRSGGRQRDTAPGTRSDAVPGAGAGETGVLLQRHSPEEVFARLRNAAGTVGNLSGVDPETLSLVILVEAPGEAPAQLLAEVHRRGVDTAIAFTLESLGAAAGPPIRPIVERLLAAL